MFVLVVVLILVSVYVGQNKKLKDGTKTGWFILTLIVSALVILLEVLGG